MDLLWTLRGVETGDVLVLHSTHACTHEGADTGLSCVGGRARGWIAIGIWCGNWKLGPLLTPWFFWYSFSIRFFRVRSVYTATRYTVTAALAGPGARGVWGAPAYTHMPVHAARHAPFGLRRDVRVVRERQRVMRDAMPMAFWRCVPMAI